MATIYLRSTDGSDASDGSTWANAKATLAAAVTAATSGNVDGTVYVSKDHAEVSAANINLSTGNVAGVLCEILCVDDTGSPEPPTAVADTATVSTTGTGSIAFAGGGMYIYGITFKAGNGASTASINFSSTPGQHRLEKCKLWLGSTSASARIQPGIVTQTNVMSIDLVNCRMEFSSTSQTANVGGRVTIHGLVVEGATLPTTLFTQAGTTGPCRLHVHGADLSALGSGKTIFSFGSTPKTDDIAFINCKLGASVTLHGTEPSHLRGAVLRFINCSSADTNYDYKLISGALGSIDHETTIVRTGGASDGTTPISRKMVSTSQVSLGAPLESDWSFIWNDSTGSSKTLTVEMVTDNVTLTDAEAWVEVDYLGTSGFPLEVRTSDRQANILGTPSNQTSSSVTWTTTGLTTPVKQKLEVTFTPQEKGLIRARVILAKASTTVYIDPQPILS